MKKLINFSEYINESSTFLKVYRGASYPYNYTVIKGDELYFVSYRKGKPFLHKYQGKVNTDVYNPNGELIKNPSKPLIYLIQSKLKGKVNESLNEEYDKPNDDIPLDRLSFMNLLNAQVIELLKNYPKEFKIDLIPGKKLTISTDNPDDLKVIVRIGNDKIHFTAKPTEGPEYEFDFSFDKNGVEEIFDLIEGAFKNDNGGIKSDSGDTYKFDDEDESTELELDVDDEENLDTPITKKPVRRTRTININVIQDVLEDAYILDDIDLKNISPEELIRRMLLETRKRTRK